jgi:hypothetical protein
LSARSRLLVYQYLVKKHNLSSLHVVHSYSRCSQAHQEDSRLRKRRLLLHTRYRGIHMAPSNKGDAIGGNHHAKTSTMERVSSNRSRSRKVMQCSLGMLVPPWQIRLEFRAVVTPGQPQTCRGHLSTSIQSKRREHVWCNRGQLLIHDWLQRDGSVKQGLGIKGMAMKPRVGIPQVQAQQLLA